MMTTHQGLAKGRAEICLLWLAMYSEWNNAIKRIKTSLAVKDQNLLAENR